MIAINCGVMTTIIKFIIKIDSLVKFGVVYLLY
jgi:hypothetical protein